MTQEEWEASNSPLLMLEALPPAGFDERLLSFSVAICHRMRHLLPMESLQALATVDEYLSGNGAVEQVIAARVAAATGRNRVTRRTSIKPVKIHPQERAAMVVQSITSLDAWNAAKDAAIACVDLLDEDVTHLLREFIGNPF